jgi:thiol-disulfide isomerase/thioredoxin
MTTRNKTAFWILVLMLFGEPISAQPDETRSTGNNELLISIVNSSGDTDTLNILDVISGTNPDLELVDQDGNTINHETLSGKVILLDFWHLRCPPCIVELPGLELLKRKVSSENFVLLTFSIESMEQIEATLFKNRTLDLTIVPNTSLVSYNAYPLKVLFNKQGQMIDLVNSGSTGKDSIQKLIDKYYPLVQKEL